MPRKGRYVRKSDQPGYVETRGGAGKPSPKRYTIDTPLNDRQERFVKELISKDGQITHVEAAINAGYPAGNARTRASELLNPGMNPHVVARIKVYRDELDAKYGVTFQRHLKDLQVIRDVALQNGAYSAAVQAEKSRGMAHGDIYVSRSEVRHGSIDSMSKDEVLKALQDIKDSYALTDITPSTEDENSPEGRSESRGRLVEIDEIGHRQK
jgi:phage terminase small subunit